CPNTGSMMGLLNDDFEAWLSPAENPERKLRYTLEMIGTPTSLVGVNTSRPNKLVHQAIAANKLLEFSGIKTIAPEQKYDENSRIDLLLEQENGQPCFVEVKNVTLAQGTTALFPDAVTSRGTKHLAELANEAAKGN